ncbi:MAG: hypothetical protein ACXWC7_03690 [Chitinophagaceae bacterium]
MLLNIVYLACLLTSSITAFIYRKELKSRQLSFFIPFLILLFIQELSVFIYILKHPTSSTGIVYNIYTPASTLVFSLFYCRIPLNGPARKLITSLLIVYLAATVFTYCCIQSIYIYNNYISLAGGFLIALCGILFLFNYFKLDNAIEEKKWLPALWITIGVVTFYPVVNISFALYKYLLAYQATIFGMKLYRLIPQLMSIFMYSCFIRAFYLCKKKN